MRDYGLWYRDVSEEPEKYQGKTVRFKAQVARLRRDRDRIFAPGRFMMTCCVEDIQFCGVPCKFARGHAEGQELGDGHCPGICRAPRPVPGRAGPHSHSPICGVLLPAEQEIVTF